MTTEPIARPWQARVVCVILALEAAALVAAIVALIVSLFVEKPTSYESAAFLALLCAAGAAFVIAVCIGLWRGRAWSRTAAIFCQLVMLALAVGSIQGDEGSWVIGAAFLVPAVVAGVLLFTRPVALYTAESNSLR